MSSDVFKDPFTAPKRGRRTKAAEAESRKVFDANKAMGKLSPEEELVREKLVEWRRDPVKFVIEVLGVEPTPHQVLLLEGVRDNKRVSIKSGHGTGKSSGAAFLVWWFLCCYPHSRVPITAPTSAQLEDVLWAEISLWGHKLPEIFRSMFEIGAGKIYHKAHPKTWFAVARTSRRENPDALQGFHGKNLLFIVDEASGVPPEIFLPVEGALTGDTNKILIQGNPTKTNGYLYDSQTKFRERWHCLTFNSEESPIVSREYIETMASQYGTDSDHYRVRVLGQFPRASSSQFISTEPVDQAMDLNLGKESYHHYPIFIGADPARFGDDSSVIIRRQGPKVWPPIKFHGIDTMEFVGHVVDQCRLHRAKMVFVDAVGIGAGVADRLKQLVEQGQLQTQVVEVQSGMGASDPKMYANIRAQMWGYMRDWLRGQVDLPKDDKMRSDLTSIEYGFNGKMQIQLERKEDMKNRGLESPDTADALALTFAPAVFTGKASRTKKQVIRKSSLGWT